jgi:mannose-6-phosphate isomerase-like protein (cupin superfamily)
MTFIIRSDDAEFLGADGYPTAVRLLADASDTGDALSTQRVTLGPGADGASPHLHKGSSELFFVVDGAAQILAGSDVTTLRSGDLAVVPPGVPHAFGAPAGSSADLLIVITPGVERFEYFRLLAALQRGESDLEDLLAAQDRFDNHFLDSPEWRAVRATGPGAGQ